MKKYIKADIKLIGIETTNLMDSSTTGNIGGSLGPGTYAPEYTGSSTSIFGDELKSESSSGWSGVFSSDDVQGSFEE